MKQRGLLALVFIGFFINFLFAATTGKISGVVTDEKTNEPLVGANIIVEGLFLGAASDSNGRFYILNVPPGSYNVSVQMIGYAKLTVENLEVSVGRTTQFSAELKTEVIEGEAVIVSANRVATKKDQTGSIRNVSSEDMELLPIESVGQIVNMQAGVVNGHFRGGRSGEVSYMIDGMQIDNALNRGQAVDLNVDAVQDMEVITGTFNAEYGKAMSGVVNLVTKDGNNDFHGSVSTFLGNYYTSNQDIWIGLDNAEIARNQDYRLYLDGPVIKNLLYFFINARYQNNQNHMVGIRRFEVDNTSDFSNYPENYYSEHTGDSAFVNMNRSENLSLSTKLTLKLGPTRTSLLYLKNDDEWHNYDHNFLYNPDGKPVSYRSSEMFTLNFNHPFSRKAFYEIKLSQIYNYGGYYLYKDPLDAQYVHDSYLAGTDYTGFYTGGQEKGHNMSTTIKRDAKFDLTWQANQQHSVKLGALFTMHDFSVKNRQILNVYRNTPLEDYPIFYRPEVLPDSTVYSDIYNKQPREFSAYIQDKMEFDEMTLNIGLRYEYFDPATGYPTQPRNPGNQLDFPDNPEKMSEYPDAQPKTSLAPRLGLGYQLGSSALLRFSYGHFTQFPPFSTMYQNNSYVIGTTSYEAIVGNPRVMPEKTVNYEVGYWMEINQFMDCEVALFYKDIYNLSTVNMVQTYNNVWYGLYGNKDYGNARGLELKYNAHYDNIYLNLNYTLQYTRGNADNPQFTFNRAGDSQDPVPTLIPMSWDQRHTLNLTIGYNTSRYGTTLTAFYGSGGIYTWSPISDNKLARINLLPNNSYKPQTFSTDLKAYYNLASWRGINARLNLQVYNLFDRLNEGWVNGNTGRANQSIIRDEDRLGHKADFVTYEERIFYPGAYSDPRQVKIGMELNF
ncbi:MAG: TonB-dependent receptor [Candidatus Marinimicrobia bacterium]|nr:TonB-dependent receptor [Candidatus Neomarinimicrobiota bacterium]